MYRYGVAHLFLVLVDLPVAARLVEVLPRRPPLGVCIALDPAVVGELMADGVAAAPKWP